MTNKPDIRTEEILLLGLCRLSFGVEIKVMLRALAEETTDWDYFCNLANQHGVASLAYRNIELLGLSELLPHKYTGFLRNAHLTTIRRNTENTLAAIDAIKLLSGSGIKVTLLKGLALELSVYGREGLRQMNDTDVLVSQSECLIARKILMKNGFESLPFKSVLHKLIAAHTGKHLPTLIKKGFNFELHHSLFGPGNEVLTETMLNETLSVESDGHSFNIPGPQLHFLYLLRHLYMHEQNNESQLRLYTDLAVLLDKHPEEILNYQLLDRAKSAGLDSILAHKLEPLRDLMGISFPGWIDELIDRNYDPASINKFVFFLKSPKNNPITDNAALYRSRVKEIPGWHRKVLFVAGDLFPTISFMKSRYGVKSLPAALLRYPHRLGKLWYLVKKAESGNR